MILTSSDGCAATSSIKEEEGEWLTRGAKLRTGAPDSIAKPLLFLDGRGAPDLFRGGAGEDDEPNAFPLREERVPEGRVRRAM